jgi:hypothetical protein
VRCAVRLAQVYRGLPLTFSAWRARKRSASAVCDKSCFSSVLLPIFLRDCIVRVASVRSFSASRRLYSSASSSDLARPCVVGRSAAHGEGPALGGTTDAPADLLEHVGEVHRRLRHHSIHVSLQGPVAVRSR